MLVCKVSWRFCASISSFAIPAIYKPLKTALIVHPTAPPPIVKMVFKAISAIVFKIVVIVLVLKISSILAYISAKSSYC